VPAANQKSVLQRLHAVRQEVPYIQRDAEVQGYSAVTHDQVTAALRDSLIKHGVLVIPRQTTADAVKVGETQRGQSIIRYEAWYEVSFISVDDSTDTLTIPIQAHANDQGDKAPGKAMSYATKYAMLKAFNIETGENEESRLDVALKRTPITAEKYEHLHQILTETGTQQESFLSYLNDQLGIRLHSLAEMMEETYQWAIQALEAKKVRQQKDAKKAAEAQERDEESQDSPESDDQG